MLVLLLAEINPFIKTGSVRQRLLVVDGKAVYYAATVQENPMKFPFLAIVLSLVAFCSAQPVLAQNRLHARSGQVGTCSAYHSAGAQIAVLEGDPMASSGPIPSALSCPMDTRSLPIRIPKGRASQ